jgi:hypothetical protein
MKTVQKILSLCLGALLLLSFAACRELVPQPFGHRMFIPGNAIIREQFPGHLVMESPSNSFEPLIEFYEEAIIFLGAVEIERDESEGFWYYAGTYGEQNNKLQISMRDTGTKVNIVVSFTDEMG